MDKLVKNILKKIESEGYEAYVVGGFVRDGLIKKQSFDVDICTNARPKDLINIFKGNQTINNYGGFNFKIKKYNIDITTYRKEKKYDNRHPSEIEYVNNLFDDIKRRDFTINTICKSYNDKIIDLLSGQDDIKRKIIRSVGNANEKFIEDPLRMLRAIRFATILNYTIEENTYAAIRDNYKLISTLSNLRIKEEISKILHNKNFKLGLSLLNDTKISDVIGLKYEDNIKYVGDILGMYAQIDISNAEFNHEEKQNILTIKKILKENRINNFTLFNYGLYLSLVAGEIMGVSKMTINKMYKNMPIKSMKDIDFNGKDIIELLNIEPSNKISNIMNDIKISILNNELKNKRNEIKKYILRKWHNE